MKVIPNDNIRFIYLFWCSCLLFFAGLILAFGFQIGHQDSHWAENGHVETSQLAIVIFALLAGILSWRLTINHPFASILSVWVAGAAVAIAVRETQSCSPEIIELNILCVDRFIKRIVTITGLAVVVGYTAFKFLKRHNSLNQLHRQSLAILILLGATGLILSEISENAHMVVLEELIELATFSILAAIPTQFLTSHVHSLIKMRQSNARK